MWVKIDICLPFDWRFNRLSDSSMSLKPNTLSPSLHCKKDASSLAASIACAYTFTRIAIYNQNNHIYHIFIIRRFLRLQHIVLQFVINELRLFWPEYYDFFDPKKGVITTFLARNSVELRLFWPVALLRLFWPEIALNYDFFDPKMGVITTFLARRMELLRLFWPEIVRLKY